MDDDFAWANQKVQALLRSALLAIASEMTLLARRLR